MELMHLLPMRGLPMPRSPRYLFSFDFDDTLFSFDSEPDERRDFFTVVRRLRMEFGVLWGINTGRSPDYLREGLIDFFHDAPNAFAPDFTVTMERHVHLADSGGFLEPADAWNAPCEAAHLELFRTHGAMLDDLLKRLEHDFSHLHLRRQENDIYSLVVNNFTGLDEVAPVIDDTIAPFGEIVTQRAGPYLRFSHRDYNKGTALAYVARHFRIPADSIAIFGDGHNDLDAMNELPAAYRACPVNAAPELKKTVAAGGGYISHKPRTLGVLDALKNGVLPHFRMK